MRLRFSLCILLAPLFAQAQTIVTFAGNGLAGNTGDGGAAISAKINYPLGGVFDKFGNYYITTGTTGNTVRKIDTAGIITTIAGTNGLGGFSGDNGLATNAKLKNPQGVTVDTNGNVYIADATNHRVRKITVSTGIITTVAGNGTAGDTGDGGTATSALIDNPLDVCTDRFGNLYIADANSSKVRKVDINGVISTFAGNGNNVYGGDGGLADTSSIGSVTGICSDDTGNIYIATIEARLFKVNTQGIITTIAGTGIGGYSGDNGLAINAEVIPTKVAWYKSGDIYIDDQSNIRIRKVNAQGIISTVAGNGIAAYSGDGGPANLAELKYPYGICTDKCGNVYIADGHDFRVRKIIYDSTCSYTSTVDTTDTTTSIHSIVVQGNISIYPNPAKEYIAIAGGSNAKDVMILNAMGQVVMEEKYNSYKANVSVSGLKAGLYYIVVKDTGTGAKVTNRFVKE